MEIRMFGMLSVECGGAHLQGREIGGPTSRSILELLLLARGHPVTKDALAAALWEGHRRPPRDAFRTLEHHVCMLRNRLSADRERARVALVTGPNSYRMNLQHVDLDLDRFDALVLQAEHADCGERRLALTRALAVARGDLLEDSPYAPWAETDRFLYRERVARCHLWLASDLLVDGDMRGALRHSEDAVRLAPYCEHAFRLQMVANHALGLSDMARSTFFRCRAALANGLNLDPTSDTVAVAAAVDAGAPVSELVAMLAPVFA